MSTSVTINVEEYFREERFVDRTKENILGLLAKLKGKPIDEWIGPTLDMDREGEEAQILFYDQMAEKIGDETVYDLFCSKRYDFVKWAAKSFIRESNLTLGNRVLDLGCATGLHTVLLGGIVGKDGESTGLDISSNMIKRAKERRDRRKASNVKFFEGSRFNLQFEEGYFDSICCINSFSEGYVDNHPELGDTFPREYAVKTAQEMSRVLKKDGKAIIIQPSLCVNQNSIRDVNLDFLSQTDLRVTKVDYYEKNPSYENPKQSGVLFVATKN